MEEEIIYFYNVKDGKYYQSRYTHRWLNNLQQQVKKQKEVIDDLKKYLKLNIELIKEQTSNDELTDNFILSRFKSLLDILKKVSR